MRHNLAVTFAIIFLPMFVTAGSKTNFPRLTPIESVGDGPCYYIDYNNFQGVDNKTYSEFYIQIGYSDLQFFKTNNKFQAGYKFEIKVVDKNGKVVEEQTVKDVFQVDTFAETVAKRRARVSLLAFTFAPGRYQLKTTLTDLETHKTAKLEEYFIATDYTTTDLMVSDIQLSQKIEPAEDGQPYVKNQRYIEPNAVRTFVHGMNDIYVYFEAYNLTIGCEDSFTNYIAHFIIRDESGKQCGRIKRLHPKPGQTAAHSIKLPVDHFLQGKYTLTVKVTCTDTGREVESLTDFHVFNNPVSMNTLDYHEHYK